MGCSAILEYLAKISQLYFDSDKKEKSRLLDHAGKITGFHRKSLLRNLRKHKNSSHCRNLKKGRVGAKIRYPEELLLSHIRFLWVAMERVSARRMKAAFVDWLPHYRQNNVNNNVKFLLQKMSVSTLDRFLRTLRKSYSCPGKGLSSTSPAKYMKNKVPINTLDSTVTRPGYVQSDTVAHCGDRLSGIFINSVTLTDLYSTWTENRALLTKKGREVSKGLRDMEKALPFSLIAINTDSGSEFLNTPVFNFCKDKKVIFTRSRPYKKNDNCYVEQKNYTHVRELFGYQRFESPELKLMMNDIYANCWNPLQNYFLPTFKLKDKIRIGSRIKKVYGPPLTPFQRLMESPDLSEEEKYSLSEKKRRLNPFELKRELEEKLSTFFKCLNRYNKEKELS